MQDPVKTDTNFQAGAVILNVNQSAATHALAHKRYRDTETLRHGEAERQKQRDTETQRHTDYICRTRRQDGTERIKPRAQRFPFFRTPLGITK